MSREERVNILTRRAVVTGGAAFLSSLAHGAAAARVSGNWGSWDCTLSHAEVNQASNLAALAAAGLPPPYNGAVAGAVGYLKAVDRIGGNNGVTIHGSGVVVVAVPAGGGIIADVTKVVTNIAGGAFGLSINIFKTALGALGAKGAPHGTVHADENSAGSEETFVLVHLKDGMVAILSFAGYFCADHGRQYDEVVADRQAIGPWEKWQLLNTTEGRAPTVSFRSDSGRGGYMCSDPSLSHAQLVANRRQIGPWEKFHLKDLGGGRIALQAGSNAKFVSVAP
jgi:hypothetical protein